MIQPIISLEMTLPSQGHCGFPSFPVIDWFCLFVDLWVLPFPLEDCSIILLLLLFKLSVAGELEIISSRKIKIDKRNTRLSVEKNSVL